MKSNIGRKLRPDYLLSIAIFCLVMFGLIAIYSVSKYYSLQVTDGASDKYYLIRQIKWVAIGLLVWIVFQSIDYKFWHRNSKYMLPLTLVLLILPLFFGTTEGGSATRWVGIGSLSFQPAEVAKLTLIIYLAARFGKSADKKNQFKDLSLPFFAVMGAISIIMFLQKDLGTLGIIIGIAASMYLMSGVPYSHIAYGGGLVTVIIWLAVKLEPYRMKRLTTFLNPDNDLLGSGYHIRNALIAIGSGGLWGLGFGQSKQKYLYLPESHTDSIFAIICEELGFLRASLIVLLFGFIAIRGYRVAKYAPDDFSKLLAVGVTTWLIWQAFINIAAMLSMLPLTGVPLPFISYGGSSLIFLLAGVGILINISKFADKNKS